MSFRRYRMRAAGPIVLLAVLAGAATGLAQGLPRLPGPLTLPQTGDSPGVVTFNHDMHVDAAHPACTTCHPKIFRILKATPRTPITHDRMDRKQSCGACHDGAKAFNRDDCTSCHRS